MAIKQIDFDSTLMEHESEILGLHLDGDEGFMINNCHWHTDKLCMTIIIARIRQIGPIRVPAPRKRIRISQDWDTGGSRLCPLERGFYEEINLFRGKS